MLAQQSWYNDVQRCLCIVQWCAMRLAQQFLHKDVLCMQCTIHHCTMYNDTCEMCNVQRCLYNVQWCARCLHKGVLYNVQWYMCNSSQSQACLPSSLADLSHSIRHSPSYPTKKNLHIRLNLGYFFFNRPKYKCLFHKKTTVSTKKYNSFYQKYKCFHHKI